MKCRVKPLFLMDAEGRLFRVTPINYYSAGVLHSRAMTTSSRRVVQKRMTILMVGVEDGTKKPSTRNGSAPTLRRKRFSGKTGK